MDIETIAPGCIDEEINKHLVFVSNLFARKNTFRPVFRLPPETLANIFSHAAHDYHEGGVDRTNFRVPDWINVSYVCRHWRNVALNSPTLWSYHFTVSHRWTEELLARSGQASLKIYIQHEYKRTDSWWSRLVELVLNHVDRIQELHLNVPVAIIPPQLSLHAPRLQIPDICPSASNSRTFTIKEGDAPALRTLKLTDCSLSWKLFDLSKVTTLVLQCALSRAPRQYIGEFLATLNRMPALTFLHLEHALLSARGFLSSGAVRRPKVNVPHLARLYIAAPASTIITLLSRANIPLQTQVWLEFESEGHFSVDDYVQIPWIVMQRFGPSGNPSPSSPTIRSLTVEFLSRKEATFIATERGDCDSQLSKVHQSQDCSVPLTILVGMRHLFEISDHFWSDICCSIPSTHIQTLHIMNPPNSHEFWRHTLGHLDGLRHIKLSKGNMPDLVPLLALAATKAQTEHTSERDPTLRHTFVPALEELELYRITFYSSNGTISEPSLLSALSTRTPRPRLSMAECKV